MESIAPLEPEKKAIMPKGSQFKGLNIKNGAKIHTKEDAIIGLPIDPNTTGVFWLKLSKVSLPNSCIMIKRVIKKNIACTAFLMIVQSSILRQRT